MIWGPLVSMIDSFILVKYLDNVKYFKGTQI